jgi:predicted GNAT family acetyltransferase
MDTENEVLDNKNERRFEMSLGEGKMAFIQYEETGKGVRALTHTEVPEEFEGQGIGSALVRKTFEIIQKENLKIVPACKFVAVYLKRHPEYQTLLAPTSK